MQPIRQQLCGYLCKQEPKRPFTKLRLRSSQLIRQRLQRVFPAAHIRIPDPNLTAPTKEEFEAWLKKDVISDRTYHKDWFDCDDFARAIRCKMFKIGQEYQTTFTVAYCEGYTASSYHAYNILIDNTDAIYIIEPQNDHIIPADQSKYKTDFIQL